MPLKLTNNTEQLEHQRLTSLINSMADAVIAVDEQVRVVLYNSAALNILDLNNLKPLTTLASVFRPLDKNTHPVEISALVKQATVPVVNRDLRLKYIDGSFINLYTSIAPVHLGYGDAGDRGYVILLRDITHEKSLEEERDEFISVVSHELRTPIAIAEGNISNAEYMAGHSEVPADIKKALKEAHNQVLFLADMINDLATLSRAERGKLNVQVDEIAIKELVTDLYNSYKPQAEAKHLKLSVEVDPNLQPLYTSKLYLREILQNFITNSLKYTHSGHVNLSVKPMDRGVMFVVTDSGIGISKADQERVFDKFFRSEDFRTREAKGTGLGLYVTMKLARLIQAEVSLTSELNVGSTFSVAVPNLGGAANA